MIIRLNEIIYFFSGSLLFFWLFWALLFCRTHKWSVSQAFCFYVFFTNIRYTVWKLKTCFALVLQEIINLYQQLRWETSIVVSLRMFLALDGFLPFDVFIHLGNLPKSRVPVWLLVSEGQSLMIYMLKALLTGPFVHIVKMESLVMFSQPFGGILSSSRKSCLLLKYDKGGRKRFVC